MPLDHRDLYIMDPRLVKKEWVEEHPVDAIVQLVKNVRKGNREMLGAVASLPSTIMESARFTSMENSSNFAADLVDEHAGQIEDLEKQLEALTKTLLEQSKEIKKLQGSLPSSKSRSKSRSKSMSKSRSKSRSKSMSK